MPGSEDECYGPITTVTGYDSPEAIMCNHPASNKAKAALMGGSLCGMLGPALGVFALRGWDLAHGHGAISQFLLMPLDALFFAWPLAVMFVGVGAFALGAIGAIIIQALSIRVVTKKILLLQAVALGLAFGSVLPVLSEAAWFGRRYIEFTAGSLFFGAVIGAICAAATFWLLQRKGLLRFQQSRAWCPRFAYRI